MSDLVKTLVVAAEDGDLKTVKKALADGADPSAMGPNSGALHCAAFNGHKSVVKVLLAHKSDPTLVDNQGFTPLHLAASKGHKAIVQQLLDNGANINALTNDKGTALHVAAASNFPQIVDVLAKAGANLEVRDKDGETPLAHAAYQGNLACVKKLVGHGADINSKSDGDDSILMQGLFAVFNNRVESWSIEGDSGGRLSKYLIRNGEFCFYRDYKKGDEDTANGYLTLSEQRQIVKLSWGPKAHQKYLDALDICTFLIKKGVEVHSVNANNTSTTGMTCYIGEHRLIEQMVRKGGDFSHEANGGVSTLHAVARSGRHDGLHAYLRDLPKEQWDINGRDDFGWTPAHYLADKGGPLKMVDTLKQHGAQLNLKSTASRGPLKKGMQAYEVAEHWRDNKLAKALKATR